MYAMNTHRRALKVTVLVTLWALAPATGHAQGSITDFVRTNPKFVQLFRKVVAEPSRQTVRIRNDGKDIALGVVVGADGWILTKAFDLKGKVTCRFSDGRTFNAAVAGVHAVHDLAVLKIDAAGLPAVKLKPSKAVPVGS